MKAKDISTAINLITGAAAVYFIGSAIAGAIKRRKGIGKVERIKRRIYKEVSLAQNAGVDFSKKYDQLTAEEKEALKNVGHEVGWKQSKRSIESGKPYVESYYGSLRRAWNAVSGVAGIGRAYNVKDANGNVCLTWIEDAQAHVDAEREIEEKRYRALEAEKRAAESRKRMKATRRKIDRDGMLPSEPVAYKSKQQQILDKFPYLKTHDVEGKPRVTDQFNYVIWRTTKNGDSGETLVDGPFMAFISEREANDTVRMLKEHSGRKDYTATTYRMGVNYVNSYQVKPVFKINIDKISGIGYAPTEEHELWEVWREQLEYGDTELDYDTWRKVVGDEYAKDVLKYMR